MRKVVISTVIGIFVAAAAVAEVGVAGAASTGGSSAADTVRELSQRGYNVQLNGTADAPLSQCTVTGIHGLTDTDSAGHPAQFTTVYVDIDCPPYN